MHSIWERRTIKNIQIMSKLLLGGDKFYKIKWDELLENDRGWGGNRYFKLGVREDFFLRPEWKGLSIPRCEKKAFWVHNQHIQRPWGKQKRVPAEESAKDFARWSQRHSWGQSTELSLVKEFGFYSQVSKKPVESFQQRSGSKWLFYKYYLGSSIEKDLGSRNQEGSRNTCQSILWTPGDEGQRLGD